MSVIHLVGIGGTGLSAIAGVLLEQGESVSGSDLRGNAQTDALAARGARIAIGHRAENLGAAELVVISSAIRPDNPEVVEARRRGLPVLKRADFLERLTAGKRTLAVAGTHGKTTTTSMLALLLVRAGRRPSFIVGSVVPELGTNAAAGAGDEFVIEADEYDGMFLGLRPWLAIITNVEVDHVDCYPTLPDVPAAFRRFAGGTVAGGTVLVCADSATARESVAGLDVNLVTYGLAAPAEWLARELRPNAAGGTSFTVLHLEEPIGSFDISIPGRHNVSNALAVVAAGARLGVQPAVIADALREFHGAERRFELKGEAGGVTVIDDYAHHPTEIQATLSAARERFPGRRLWAVFQPHTYSRTRAFFDDFTRSFCEADIVLVTDIYAAREPADAGVSSADLASAIGAKARHVPSLDDASAYLLGHVRPGDVVLTLGAGDGYVIGERLLEGMSR